MDKVNELSEAGVSFDPDAVWPEIKGTTVKVMTHEDLSIGRASLEKLLLSPSFVAIHFCKEINGISIVYKEDEQCEK